jgi:glycolate oxidase subunit GlcD
MTLAQELGGLLGPGAVIDGADGSARAYLSDATEWRAIRGRADAIALPADASEVAALLRWCYDHDVPLTPRGGGTGFAGGAVPLDGGVVLGTERLVGPIRIDPGEWRAEVPAGTVTADLHRRARENGLFFPPDPGAPEQSLLGGNVATNAGGPHTFKYGVTGQWVTGLEVAVAPGELIRLGGPVRKDVAGYDLRSLLIGSEGTLGVVTSAWLRLIPAPEAALPVAGFYPDLSSGCRAVANVMGSGLIPATLEFLDEATLQASIGALSGAVPELAGEKERARFLVISEADGRQDEAVALRSELMEAIGEGAVGVHAPTARHDVAALWRWRGGVSMAVAAQHGGKLSEDIVVPVDQIEPALRAVQAIGARHDLATCCWGHAGDGNLHATFMLDRGERTDVERAETASQELFDLAIRLGGSVSGEHGIGLVKRGALGRQWNPGAVRLHEQVKRTFDPKGLLNPGKKLAR